MKQSKRILPFILTALTVIGIAGISASADNQPLERVEVVGHGTVYAKADTATIDFCMETNAADYASARAENEKVYEKLKKSVSNIGALSEETLYSYAAPDAGTVSFTRCLRLRTNQIDSLGAIIEKLTDNGATGINYIGYSLKESGQLRQEALMRAVQDGQKKAGPMTASLELTEIRESFGGYCCEDCRNEIAVSCDVILVYTAK